VGSHAVTSQRGPLPARHLGHQQPVVARGPERQGSVTPSAEAPRVQMTRSPLVDLHSVRQQHDRRSQLRARPLLGQLRRGLPRRRSHPDLVILFVADLIAKMSQMRLLDNRHGLPSRHLDHQ
jgi:hypothetical protein